MCEHAHRVGSIRFRLRLSELFRIQAGLAILLAAAAILYRLPADLPGREISPVAFTFATSSLALVAYAVSRFVFSRFTCPLVAVLVGMIAGASFARPMENSIELATLGACIAFSWVVGLGWLDRNKSALLPLFRRTRRLKSDLPPGANGGRDWVIFADRAARGRRWLPGKRRIAARSNSFTASKG